MLYRNSVMAAVAIAIILAVWLAREMRANEKLEVQLAAANDKRQVMAERERCAAQAEKKFHDLGFSENSAGPSVAMYADHYDAAKSRCFMTIDSTNYTNTSEIITRFLFDAYEQREFAEYTWMSSQTKKYWEVPPVECKLMPASGEERNCKSEQEYLAFVAQYMH
jgi:hypothetical protein